MILVSRILLITKRSKGNFRLSNKTSGMIVRKADTNFRSFEMI